MKKEFTLALILFIVVIAAIFAVVTALPAAQARQDARTSAPACAAAMHEIIASGQGDVYDMTGVEEYEEPNSYYLMAYRVEGNFITDPQPQEVPADLQDEQQDTALQAKAWQTFSSIVPPAYRKVVGAYRPFTDGADNTLAAVEQNPEDITQWILDVDIADVKNRDLLLSTLVHEYAHVLTLNAEQVIPDQEVVDNWNDYAVLQAKAAVCPDYFTDTGCSRADSYVNAFYNRFWRGDVAAKWTPINAMQYENPDDLTPYYDALYQFYKARRNEFVDDYATTHPTEDIAESFTYFVFTQKPSGTTIRDQKITFFYQYPELAALREEILKGACAQP